VNLTKSLLGKKIKQLRKNKGWTQDYMSELVGINAKSILRIENGKTFPTVENLEKIADIFGLEISDLFENKAYADKKVLLPLINNMISNLDDEKIKMLYIFLNSISQ